MQDSDSYGRIDPAGVPWPCWIEVDLDAVRHNVATAKGLLGQDCQVMAVVKSQAYGHGAIAVARAALEAGASWLAVARVREGAQLRAAGISAPILVLGAFDEGEVPSIVESDLRPTLIRLDQARMVSRIAQAAGRRIPIHVKVDTGLSRYGSTLGEVEELLLGLPECPGLYLEALFSHFATADDPQGEYAASQLRRFQDARAALESRGIAVPMAHMASSGAILGLPPSQFNMVRLGISLYGLYPSATLENRARLRPALSMRSRAVKLFTVPAGQAVGYGCSYVAAETIRAALIPVGYADGLPRSHSNRGSVLVNGCRAPLIGRISMDQCVVDVTGCGDVQEGAPVVLIGSQGGETISCEDFAALSGTINYEVVTSLGFRVPRVYLEGGRAQRVAFLDEGRVEELSREHG